ncbi:MAG: M20/M25/M40 family metallo-hydrolase [Myxococcales bacterium]|nr:M20/M25/M40 family metallo-hydrolase [Myxococcales bacterium]
MILDQAEFRFLEQLLRLRTTHEPEHAAEHERCRELVAREADRRGLRTRTVPSDPFPSLLVGTKPEEKAPRVLLAAHLDVVPAGEQQFAPRVEGNRLKARGASDMKFAAPLFLKAVADLSPGERDGVLIAFTFDEEIGGNRGTRFLLDDEGLRPGAAFIPDGGDNFQLEADEKGVLQFRVKTAGKAAHGSRPWLGENAIDKFLAVYADLRKEFPVVSGPETWGPTLNLGKVTAGAAANQVPDACEALLDVRFVETTTLAATTAQVERIIGGRGEFSPIVAGDLFHLDRDGEVCRRIQAASRKHRNGQELAYYRSEGASDARFFTKYGIPVVLTKPICAGHHSVDEWLDLDSLEPYYRMMLEFVRTSL